MDYLVFFTIVLCVIAIIFLWSINKKNIEKNKSLEIRLNSLVYEKKEWENKYIKQRGITDTELEDLKKERRDFESRRNSILAEIEITKHEVEREKESLVSKKEEMNRLMAYQKSSLEMEYCRKEKDCNRKIEEIKNAMSTRTPFSHVAEMVSDFKLCVFEDAEKYLISRHAPKSAETIREMRNKCKTILYKEKEMRYKYKFLLDVFPELKSYVDDEESLTHLSDFKDYEEFTEEYDRVRQWLSNEEYESLSVIERNQRALERYKNRQKSNWEVGMEYEMYIGYLLRKNNFHTIQYGIENGLNDLGRDIIAERSHLNQTRTIYIIQCKRWSANNPLHENVICQLFGTKMEYEIKHRHFLNTKVIPVLVTTADLSDTAKEFAKRLEVIVKQVQMGDYPMIKCNINNNQRIYHLPFDQQYYRTQISNIGEFYAWNVEEAENAGFRRAKRWNANIN